MNVGEGALTLVIGLVSGMLSGALGIGGGVIMVPAMVLVLGVQQSVAQGTSLLVILPTALSGAQSHYRRGNIDIQPTIWMGLLGAVTAAAGAYLAVHIDQQRLRQVFAVYLLLVGGKTIYNGIRKSG
ncbi:MAG TPA: sulfite exporter TauE/SafE family protein [Candidatus Solibacter sp.]|jgi:uncharacterized membrane protein YfcA|nr:sulfite exporter TauE/SafE family protein [Candidatus Solibacter sp.]